MTDADRYDLLIEVAKSGFAQAIDMGFCVSMLAYSNREDIAQALDAAGAGQGGILVQKALFQRLLLLTMMAFDPVRRGDIHLRVGIEQLAVPAVVKAIAGRGREAKLAAAIEAFAAAENTPSFVRIRHIRNKEAAHTSALDPGISRASIRDLLELASSVSRIAEALANGTGIVSLTLESQMIAPIDSAIAFWRPWMKANAA